MIDTKGDRPVLGIALMVGFCILAPISDSLAKILGDTVPLVQLVFIRFLVQAMILLPLTGLRAFAMTRRVAGFVVLRTVLHIVGIGAMFTSLRFLPLADAIAIVFVMPFIILLLGKFVMGEAVGPRRLAACCVGFCGTLLVIQPSFAAVGPPAMLPLVVAVTFAMFMLTTRQIARDIDPVPLQAVSGTLACLLLGPFLLLPDAGHTVFSVVMPDGTGIVLLLLVGIIGTVAHLLMTWSLRFAPSTTLAPMQYLEIPVATVVGYVLFQDWPNPMAMAGILVTCTAGIYIIAREQALARRGALA